MQNILCQMCGERDYSSQETVQVIMGCEFYQSSREFVIISLYDEEWDFAQIENETVRRTTTIVEKYATRPTEFDLLSLLDFTSNYYQRGENFSKRKKSAVVRVFPIFKLALECNNEPYFRIECLLRIPWRNTTTLFQNHQSWQDLYFHTGALEDRRIQLDLEQLLEENKDDLDDLEELSEFDDDNIRDMEWMEAARMGGIEHGVPVLLGQRDIDIQYDWLASWHLFQNAESFPDFIKEMKRQEQDNIPARDYNFPQVPFSSEQTQVIELLEKQIHFIKNGGISPPQITIVQGKAGSGKSTLIQHLTARLTEEFGSNSFALLAPTETAAVNINGSTIHSKLRIRPKQTAQFQMNNFTLNTFQQEFSSCKFIIIDEYIMLSCRLLKFMNQRCREAAAQSRKRFGGIFVYFLGDLKQLLPVKDRPMYSSNWGRAPVYFEGQCIFCKIKSFIFLSNSNRQAEGSEQVFRALLDRLSSGETTVQDWEIMMSRVLDHLAPNEKESFDSAIRLYATNQEVRNFSQRQLEILRQPVKVIYAWHNSNTAKDFKSLISRVYYLFLDSFIGVILFLHQI